MASGLALVPLRLTLLLDQFFRPIHEDLVVLLRRKNQESPGCAATKQDTEGAVGQSDLLSQYLEVSLHLFFGGNNAGNA